jgi:hypothetical protein
LSLGRQTDVVICAPVGGQDILGHGIRVEVTEVVGKEMELRVVLRRLLPEKFENEDAIWAKTSGLLVSCWECVAFSVFNLACALLLFMKRIKKLKITRVTTPKIANVSWSLMFGCKGSETELEIRNCAEAEGVDDGIRVEETLPCTLSESIIGCLVGTRVVGGLVGTCVVGLSVGDWVGCFVTGFVVVGCFVTGEFVCEWVGANVNRTGTSVGEAVGAVVFVGGVEGANVGLGDLVGLFVLRGFIVCKAGGFVGNVIRAVLVGAGVGTALISAPFREGALVESDLSTLGSGWWGVGAEVLFSPGILRWLFFFNPFIMLIASALMRTEIKLFYTCLSSNSNPRFSSSVTTVEHFKTLLEYIITISNLRGGKLRGGGGMGTP